MNKILQFFKKIIFLWKRPKIIIVINGNHEITKRIISQILDHSFRIEKEVLLVDDIKKVNLSTKKYLILNFDNDNTLKIKEKTLVKVLTFGFQNGADFQASDIKFNGGTNFKMNYQGSIVPFWLEKTLEKEQIYPILAAIAVGVIFDLNLVKISQILREYKEN